MISKKLEEELYSFIVDSNFEYDIIDQCSNKKVKQELKEWLQIED